MDRPNPAKFSNWILRLLYDRDFLRKSSFYCSYNMARCRQAPYKMASEMGLEPLQITSTCYKMAGLLKVISYKLTLEIGLLYGPGGQPFHRGNFNGDPSAIWVNYVDRVYVVNISISMSMSSLPTSTMRRLRLQTKHAELNRLDWFQPPMKTVRPSGSWGGFSPDTAATLCLDPAKSITWCTHVCTTQNMAWQAAGKSRRVKDWNMADNTFILMATFTCLLQAGLPPTAIGCVCANLAMGHVGNN